MRGEICAVNAIYRILYKQYTTTPPVISIEKTDFFMDKTDISFLCGAIPGGIGRFRRAQPTHCGGGSVPRYRRGSLPDGYSGYKGKSGGRLPSLLRQSSMLFS